MKLLEEKILNEGKILDGGILKVDMFLNHLVDVPFITELGRDIYNNFKNCEVTKILTVESSGISIAFATAQFFNCKILVAKKSRSLNISKDVYSSPVFSFTHKVTNNVLVSKEFLNKDDKVLIVDDFLASGEAGKGLIDIVKQAGAKVVGYSAVIEKTFQNGHKEIEDLGVKVYSLARIAKMEGKNIEFVK